MKAVTIAICNYNYERYLADAIDSALAQDYAATKVIVIDDGSVDASREVIDSYGSQIRSILKENGGQVSAYNRAIEEIDTEYAILLDADDVLYPHAVTEVMRRFESSGCVKVQFKLDVIDNDGQPSGIFVPHSDPPVDCGRLLKRGWLYPSPPASGNAYRVRALRRIFPLPETPDGRYGADFYAIYGVVLVGQVASIPRSLGAYRVHNSAERDVSFANSEKNNKAPKAYVTRWRVLRRVAQTRLGIELPVAFWDFSHEKAIFSERMYGAQFLSRWRWFALESHSYFHSIVANPFWSAKKKVGTIGLSCLCLFPYAPLSDLVVRYISNPLARGGRKGC
ncbi:glycosyl transferase [Burkholderia ubonensis]|uniref:glycosyltransferase family 2 protein n=1 Tax=Burkholderia TaxID=32008 RepID=UPI0005ACD6D4|nr:MULTISPECIES: glycosyltransferase family 2 protein [Burkholderia]KIP17363.1 glycosyltransferase like 2 family protein [Burkholderia sp. MSHR3999]KVH78806.1 glycosyl transferase [Burkholderia ubonensis]KVO82800.1 glycosyl transferase [Burkholderia ubonensis]KVU04999.1 glycosyl transferase [Burkholderia ubonensis]KVZ58014.1 glycosyl transferase [Burkholderia ubonensis]